MHSFDGFTWDVNDDGEAVSVSGGMRCGCGVAAGCIGMGRATVGMTAGIGSNETLCVSTLGTGIIR